MASLFLLLVIIVDINSLDCEVMFCGFEAFILGAPWTFKWFDFINHGHPVLIFQLLNTIIIYFIGAGISKTINLIKKG